MAFRRSPYGGRSAASGCLARGGGRLIIAAIIAGIAIVTYVSSRAPNPVTGEAQYVDLTPEQEIALGLRSAPELADQYGGLHPDAAAQALVDRVGHALLAGVENSPYPFEFHLLADGETINAFALPGGQVFITAGLYQRLESEGQLAGVMAHEIGHVLERHGAQQLATQKLTLGLTGAVGVAATDPNSPVDPRQAAAVAAVIGQVINMKYGRDDELESDRWGVRLLGEAGYDPRSMIRVMQILAEASGSRAQPEFFSTHPNPENRIARIEAAIREAFPNGVPEGLKP